MSPSQRRQGPSKTRARRSMRNFRKSLKKFDPLPVPRKKSGPRVYRALYVVRSDSIVKVGITGNLERRLAQHKAQGLEKVVYVLHSSDSVGIVNLERSWKKFVRLHPQLRVTRSELPDGYTEAAPLTNAVKEYIDRLLKEKF